jgi:type VI secretion system secreted protein VgrG
MASYTQSGRPLAVSTPLGQDQLLLTGFTGHEAVSQLFSFHLDLLAENRTSVPFEKLLGQPISIRLEQANNRQRYLNGICSRFSQGARDDVFTAYRMEVVPQVWLLTRCAQSRIFQHLSIPDILKKVFAGFEVAYEIKGTFQPRDYCVQYRETDFNFASRLMEEEGIYYFFTHTETGHKLVLANTPESHPDVSGESKLIFDVAHGPSHQEETIGSWEKEQELRSGKYTLWDHCFELPDEHLQADKTIQDSVAVGTVTHKLRVGGNEKLEIYTYPGEYAQRFDGVDKGGADNAADLRHIFQDNQRTAGIRMQQEAAAGLVVRGTSNCRNLQSGFGFALERHYNGNGPYVLLEVRHTARGNSYRSEGSPFVYENVFRCIPKALPFRPPRLAAKPTVPGVQTAVVVGPLGSEIFVDKYGRVKVQFHWDREGKQNADSSCWLRVAQIWAGNRWGAFFWPRVGHEVVVAFEEGDPDQPIIIGSVYNAKNMPAMVMPSDRMLGGIKSCIFTGQPGVNFNALIFYDGPGQEHVHLHSERSEMSNSETNKFHYVHKAQFKFHGDF